MILSIAVTAIAAALWFWCGWQAHKLYRSRMQFREELSKSNDFLRGVSTGLSCYVTMLDMANNGATTEEIEAVLDAEIKLRIEDKDGVFQGKLPGNRVEE